MPHLNYNPSVKKGQRKEYKVLNDERKLGNLAIRSAGSHTPIDIISIDVHSRVIKFIQCKPDNFSEKEAEKLCQEMRELNNAYRCEFEVR